MSDPIIHEIDLGDAVPRPQQHQIARKGARRLVKLAPVLAGVPVIWRNPNRTRAKMLKARKFTSTHASFS